MPKIHDTRFPVTSAWTGKLPTCCGLVSITANKSATSRCNGIWEMTRHNRHSGILPAPPCYRLVTDLSFVLWTCYGEVVNLLRTCYGETGVVDFGLGQIDYIDT